MDAEGIEVGLELGESETVGVVEGEVVGVGVKLRVVEGVGDQVREWVDNVMEADSEGTTEHDEVGVEVWLVVTDSLGLCVWVWVTVPVHRRDSVGVQLKVADPLRDSVAVSDGLGRLLLVGLWVVVWLGEGEA